MRFALLVPEAGLGTGLDLTRYFLVCGGSILALVVLAVVFRRSVAQHLKRRAARRSLQVLDVLPLSGKQKLVVVRCYDRSFLLGVGDKEVRSIAELELAHDEVQEVEPVRRRNPVQGFAAALKRELVQTPPAAAPREPGPSVERPLKDGVLA